MGTKTIAAIATAAGVGGIGTLRISGEKAVSIADKVFYAESGKLCSLKGYQAKYGHIYWENALIDEAVALVFRAPHSYTGEDVVEITVHGGEYVTKAVLRAVLSAGAVLAGPGEFTRRAFENGKMDLTKAEAVMEIISASGEKSLRAANTAASGAVFKKIDQIKGDLLFAAATISAFSDFPDEEPSFSGIDKLPKMLASAFESLDTLIKDFDKGRVLRQGVRTAIIGSTNVGKSTLMNCLSGDERAIVTSVAGTTRDILEETVDLGDVKLCLLDTAGLRETDDPVERIGVDRTKKAIENADLLLFVTDSKTELTHKEKELFESVKNKNVILVFNKCDLEAPKLSESFGSVKTVSISAKTGEGIKDLCDAIGAAAGAADLSGNELMLSGERQRNCAERALVSLKEAIQTLEGGYTYDAVGILIDSALESIMELTGESVTVEVADEIFKNFCVGK